MPPQGGGALSHEIIATHDARTIVVYQAYGWSVAGPALSAGRFVAPFSVARMTWIKTSFLWMMYRSAWGRAPGQEHILQIRLPRSRFDALVREAVPTTPGREDKRRWRRRLDRATVRVQWDPDRDLRGGRRDRRAIQLGLCPPLVAEYAAWPLQIVDLTERVHEICALRDAGQLDRAAALLPQERAYAPRAPT